MRKLVLALTVMVLAGGSGLAARTVTIGVFDGAAPLVFVDPEGEAAGFYPDVFDRCVVSRSLYSLAALCHKSCDLYCS